MLGFLKYDNENHSQLCQRRGMNNDGTKAIRDKIVGPKARRPAHSVPLSIWQQLEELEDELEKVSKVESRR